MDVHRRWFGFLHLLLLLLHQRDLVLLPLEHPLGFSVNLVLHLHLLL